MSGESRFVIFRSFGLAFWHQDGVLTHVQWQGPRGWESAIRTACKSWVANQTFAGMDIVEYLDALDIGRNILKDDKT